MAAAAMWVGGEETRGREGGRRLREGGREEEAARSLDRSAPPKIPTPPQKTKKTPGGQALKILKKQK